MMCRYRCTLLSAAVQQSALYVRQVCSFILNLALCLCLLTFPPADQGVNGHLVIAGMYMCCKPKQKVRLSSPVYQLTVVCSLQAETYRNQVAGVRTDMLTDIMHGRAWTELKRDCSETCVPDLAAQTKQFFHLAVIGAIVFI